MREKKYTTRTLFTNLIPPKTLVFRSYLDGAYVRTTLSPLVNATTFKKIRMAEVGASMGMPKAILEEYTAITKRLGPLVRNVETFKLVTFILMFDGVSCGGGQLGDRMSAVQAKYLALFRRRLRHLSEEKEEDTYKR